MTEERPALWRRVFRLRRARGFGGVWFAALARGGYRRLLIFSKALADPGPPIVARVQAEIRPLRRDDEGAFAALGQEAVEVYRRRLEGGHECWGAWCGGELRHIAWVAFGEAWVEYLGCRLILADDVAYLYRAFTARGYRGLGIAKARWAVCQESLRARRIRLGLCAVVPENREAISTWLDVGYRRVAIARSVGVGRLRRVWLRLDGGGAPDGWRFA